MNIYFTFDYELFFGSNTGSIDKCIIEPTNKLIELGKEFDVKFIFFVDSGYILKLQEYKERFPELGVDYKKITDQIKELSFLGHDIQLHIHSHWEDSYYDGNKWVMDTSRYRIHSFSEVEIENIINKYKKVLTDIVGDKVFAYRAGGWCIQPFLKIKKALVNNNIWLDSTVFHGGLNTSETHYYNFKRAPKKDKWKFENSPLSEDEKGSFFEFPITATKVSPVFFYRYLFSKLFSIDNYKSFGDGSAVPPSKKYIMKLLIKSSYSCCSVDGMKSELLKKIFDRKKGIIDNFIVIGHPKALSEGSIKNMREFISNNIEHNFITFTTYFKTQ